MQYQFNKDITISDIVNELGDVKPTDIVLEKRFNGTIAVEFKKGKLSTFQETKLYELLQKHGYNLS